MIIAHKEYKLHKSNRKFARSNYSTFQIYMISNLLPTSFSENISSKLGPKIFSSFIESLDAEVPVSIRINQKKMSKPSELEQIPWCENGFYLSDRPIFTLDPAFHSGAYYVQEASSMFIGYILEKIGISNNGLKILDLSAAPGGKSTLIASILNGKGLLVANEIIKNRAYTLKYNLCKEGYSNVIVTNNDPKDFSQLTSFFDIILVDAPCSGEGMFRKDPNAIGEWSPENVKNCSLRQQKIIHDVIPALKPHGYLIYSTCTYNDAENIDNITKFADQYDLKSVDLDVPDAWQIVKTEKNGCAGYQFYPHLVKGEGFFAALLQKNNDAEYKQKLQTSKNLQVLNRKNQPQDIETWVDIQNRCLLADKMGTIHLFPEAFADDAKILDNYLRLIYCGTSVGLHNKNILIPDHSLALSLDRSSGIKTYEMDLDQALHFLKKDLSNVENAQKGWNLATYKGQGIGWFKNIGDRINNYLPAEYRILMDINKIR